MPPPNYDVLLVQLQYPGMSYVESEITRAWLRAHGAEYDRIEFNFRLGKGLEVGDEYDAATRRAAELLTQKRADIVTWQSGYVTLIEVKVRIAFPTIGQLLGYRVLFRQQHPDQPVTRLLAIGRSVVHDSAEVLTELGVDIETYPRQE